MSLEVRQMPLFEVLPLTTPVVEQLVLEITSLLPALRVKQVAGRNKDVKLFEHQQTKECIEKPRGLFSTLAQVCIRVK
jgi:hypothetical protein